MRYELLFWRLADCTNPCPFHRIPSDDSEALLVVARRNHELNPRHWYIVLHDRVEGKVTQA